MRKLEHPKKPRKPNAPIKPKEPNEMINDSVLLDEVSVYSYTPIRMTEILDKMKQNAKKLGSNDDINYEDISVGCDDQSIEFYADITVKNSNYEYEKKMYPEKLKNYKRKYDIYLVKLKQYKKEMQTYENDIEEYNAFMKKKHIAELEAKLKELKS